MPELPEVETYTRYFARHALRQTIHRVHVLDERILGDIRKDRFARELKGAAFTRVHRHGKHLFADAGRRWLHLHFGMTGDLSYFPSSEEPPRFAKVVFAFEGGQSLAFEDMRLFGGVDLVDSPEAFVAQQGLGPDPLSLDLRSFRRLLADRRGAIKSLLMSQEIIAGIGNLYADETLFQTSIHPRRQVDALSDREVRAIFTAMRRILEDVIERHAAGKDHPPRNLIHHREEGARCPRCGGEIARSVVFGRTTYHCRNHQT